MLSETNLHYIYLMNYLQFRRLPKTKALRCLCCGILFHVIIRLIHSWQLETVSLQLVGRNYLLTTASFSHNSVYYMTHPTGANCDPVCHGIGDVTGVEEYSTYAARWRMR